MLLSIKAADFDWLKKFEMVNGFPCLQNFWKVFHEFTDSMKSNSIRQDIEMIRNNLKRN